MTTCTLVLSIEKYFVWLYLQLGLRVVDRKEVEREQLGTRRSLCCYTVTQGS